jgi:hypothetical protein
LVDPISDLILSHGRHIWPEGRETLGEVFHQAHKAAQFVLGYGLLWSSSAEMGNALIAKVCQAPVKAPINGIINAAKLIDRVSNVVRYVLVKRIIAHALNQCVDHIRTFHAAVNALISDRSVISVEQCMDPNNRHVLAGYESSQTSRTSSLTFGPLIIAFHAPSKKLNEITVRFVTVASRGAPHNTWATASSAFPMVAF